MRRALSLLVLFVFSLPVGAETILDADFGAAEIASYENNQIIGTGNDGARQMTARVDVENVTIRVAEHDGSRVLEFTNENAPLGQAGVVKAIPEEEARKENLRLRGEVEFTPLPVSGRRGVFQIALNSGEWLTTSHAVTSLQLTLEGSLQLKYGTEGGTGTAVKLQPDTRYHVAFAVDFSSPQQDTWEFTLREGDGESGAILFSSGPLKTRAPRSVPGLFVLGCGFGPGEGSDSYVRIHRVKLSSEENTEP